VGSHPWTRRQFLATLATTGVAGSSRQIRPRDVPTKAVLTASDFTYLGAFRMPTSVRGQDAAWGKTLAVRYVDGRRRFLSITVNHNLYEVDDPGVGDSPNTAPIAPAVRFWGTSAFDARYTVQYGLTSGFVYGIFWDETDRRLYFNYGDPYKANALPDSSVGYATLNDATGVATSVGSWQVGHNSKMTMCGTLAIPDWFAQTFTDGRRLASGFGGYQSIVATGPASMGPALFAFAPPTNQPVHSMLPSTPLLAYPYNSRAYTNPDRVHRDPDYRTEFDGWNPKDGVGYNTWVDGLHQGGVWIDLPDRHGVIFCLVEGNGRVWYERSTTHSERGSHWWYIYDPMSLAAVARGGKETYEIQPNERVPVKYPSATFSYPLPPWQDEAAYLITGTAYDALTGQLFVAIRFAYGSPGVQPENGHVVYAFQVNATGVDVNRRRG